MGKILMPGTGRGRPGIKKHYDSPTRKIDPGKIAAHAAAGLTHKEIAAIHGVAPSNVTRFLERYSIQQADTERYKKHRADIFAFTGSKASAVVDSVLDSIGQDIENGVLDALEPRIKAGIARDLSVVKGVYFDKERLERGQSSQNISLIGKMMGSALEIAHKTPEPTPIEAPKLGS